MQGLIPTFQLPPITMGELKYSLLPALAAVAEAMVETRARMTNLE